MEKLRNICTFIFLDYLSIILSLSGCNDGKENKVETLHFDSFDLSSIQPSLISEDHTSEGVLITLDNGRILHFFRLDKGKNGDHTSNQGAIYKRFSDDNAISWSKPELVYDTPGLDDRNISGGLLEGGGYYVDIQNI